MKYDSTLLPSADILILGAVHRATVWNDVLLPRHLVMRVEVRWLQMVELGLLLLIVFFNFHEFDQAFLPLESLARNLGAPLR